MKNLPGHTPGDVMSSKVPSEPQDAKEYFNRGLAYANKEEWGNAIADFSKAIELDPEYAVAYINRGVAYFKKEEWDTAIGGFSEAIEEFSKATEPDPEYAEAYFFRGLAYIEKEEWDNAIADFSKAIALNPEYADAYFNRGVAYSKKEEWDNAIANFSKAIELNPHDADAYFNRGIAYSKKEEWDNAIADFNIAIKLDPRNAKAHAGRGAAYYSKEKLDSAIAEYGKAIDLNPQYTNAYFNRGTAYGKKGELDNAIADFDKAIDLNPKYADAYFNRGVAYSEKEELDNAIANFSKAIELNPQDADAYINRGTAYGKKGELDNAFKDFVCAGKKESASKSKYTEVYVASIVNDVANNGGDPAVIAKHAVVEIFFKILKRIENIQNALFHEPQKNREVAHYTSLDTLKNLISKEGGKKCFRLYNSAYMNDPEEGRVFFKIMDKIVNARTQEGKEVGQKYDMEKKFYEMDSDMSYRSPAYIGSFIPAGSEKKDNLHLWRMYGKQNEKEAAGSCLIFPEESFAKDHRPQIGQMRAASTDINLEEQDKQPPIYKIVYTDTENITEVSGVNEKIADKLIKELGKLAECLEKVGGAIESITDDTKGKSKQSKLTQLVRELLDSIRFLFKASHYKEEREVRVLQLYYPEENMEDSGEIKVDAEQIPPCFYLETPKSFCFREVILGRRVRHFQEWRKWIKDQDSGLKVERSEIPYGNENA